MRTTNGSSVLVQAGGFRLGGVRRLVALAAVMGAGAAMAAAQTPSQPVASPVATVQATPLLDAVAQGTVSGSQLFSSSLSSSQAETSAATTPVTEASLKPLPVNFANAMQYGGGQRRYGRPRYRGGNTNADGSSKYTFAFGAGFGQPLGDSFQYYTPSYGFQVGGGRQFNKNFAVLLQFDFDHLGLTGQTLTNQVTLYNNDINYYCNLNPATCATNGVADYTSLDGNAHIWSFTLNPTYTIYTREGLGAYLVAGVGFYHKVTNFLAPESEEYCDPYYGFCEPITANAVIDHYTSNAPGFNGGFGLTYKFSRFSNERLYGEVRYVFVDNSQRNGVTVNSPVATTYNLPNDFPANSHRTTYVPVKFGIRF